VRLPSKKYSFYAERSVSRLLWLDFPQGRFGLARGIGAETLARAMIIIETAKMNALNLQAYLADILACINDHKINRLDDLLPWNVSFRWWSS